MFRWFYNQPYHGRKGSDNKFSEEGEKSRVCAVGEPAISGTVSWQVGEGRGNEQGECRKWGSDEVCTAESWGLSPASAELQP